MIETHRQLKAKYTSDHIHKHRKDVSQNANKVRPSEQLPLGPSQNSISVQRLKVLIAGFLGPCGKINGSYKQSTSESGLSS